MKLVKRVGSFAICLLLLALLALMWMVLAFPQLLWSWVGDAVREVKDLWEITGERNGE